MGARYQSTPGRWGSIITAPYPLFLTLFCLSLPLFFFLSSPHSIPFVVVVVFICFVIDAVVDVALSPFSLRQRLVATCQSSPLGSLLILPSFAYGRVFPSIVEPIHSTHHDLCIVSCHSFHRSIFFSRSFISSDRGT